MAVSRNGLSSFDRSSVLEALKRILGTEGNGTAAGPSVVSLPILGQDHNIDQIDDTGHSAAAPVLARRGRRVTLLQGLAIGVAID